MEALVRVALLAAGLAIVAVSTTTTTTPAPSTTYNGTRLPLPPRGMTAVQTAVYARATKDAAFESRRATPAVLSTLDGAAFRRRLREECCPAIADLPAAELLKRFLDEISVAEIVGNFVASPESEVLTFDPTDVHLPDAEMNPAFRPSAWELFVGRTSIGECSGSNQDSNAAEMDCYGFPPFSLPRRCRPTTYLEAANRPLYFIVNVAKIDAGSLFFGDVALVLRRRNFVDASGILAPADTGLWQALCGDAQQQQQQEEEDYWRRRSPPVPFITRQSLAKDNNATVGEKRNRNNNGWGYDPDCAVWSGNASFGTTAAVTHLVDVASRYYRRSDWLYEHFARSVGDVAWGATGVPFGHLANYWEVALARSLFYSDDDQDAPNENNVRFVVGGFTSLFGDDEWGRRLQEWCVDRGWLLVWARGDRLNDPNATANQPGFLFPSDMTTPQPFNGRFLDLVVADAIAPRLASNVTAALADGRDAFDDAWTAATASRAQADAIADFEDVQATLPQAATIEPLRAGDCPDPDACVGVTLVVDDDDDVNSSAASQSPASTSRACVCYRE